MVLSHGQEGKGSISYQKHFKKKHNKLPIKSSGSINLIYLAKIFHNLYQPDDVFNTLLTYDHLNRT